jgi:hypothetical protein
VKQLGRVFDRRHHRPPPVSEVVGERRPLRVNAVVEALAVAHAESVTAAESAT